MNCLTCGYTMQFMGIMEDAEVNWCVRCGSLQSNIHQVPLLVERCRWFEKGMGQNKFADLLTNGSVLASQNQSICLKPKPLTIPNGEAHERQMRSANLGGSPRNHRNAKLAMGR